MWDATLIYVLYRISQIQVCNRIYTCVVSVIVARNIQVFVVTSNRWSWSKLSFTSLVIFHAVTWGIWIFSKGVAYRSIKGRMDHRPEAPDEDIMLFRTPLCISKYRIPSRMRLVFPSHPIALLQIRRGIACHRSEPMHLHPRLAPGQSDEEENGSKLYWMELFNSCVGCDEWNYPVPILVGSNKYPVRNAQAGSDTIRPLPKKERIWVLSFSPFHFCMVRVLYQREGFPYQNDELSISFLATLSIAYFVGNFI